MDREKELSYSRSLIRSGLIVMTHILLIAIAVVGHDLGNHSE